MAASIESKTPALNELSQSLLLEQALRIGRMRLLPLLVLMYILDFLNRANLSYVKAAYQTNTGISNAAYSFGAGVFFIGYSIFAIPANLMLHRLGARIWMCSIMIIWGLVSACMAFAHTETWFYFLRFLLGVAEAGFFPGVIFYLTKWFPEKARGQALGIFYWGFPLAMIIGGPLSGWLMDVGGKRGIVNWQWMFIVEGMMSSAVGVAALFYLVDGPERAPWFKQEERNALLHSLHLESAEKEKHGPSTLLSAFKDAKVLFFGLIYFAIQTSVYGVVFFLPARIAETMHTNVGLAVGLITAIPWICSAMVTRFMTLYADRTGWHRVLAAMMLAVAAIGIMTSALSDNPYWVVLAFCIAASGFVSAQPLFWTQPSNYLSGIAAAGGIGMINTIGNFGGLVAPSIKTYAEASLGMAQAGMFLLSIIGLVAALILVVCYRPPKVASLLAGAGSTDG